MWGAAPGFETWFPVLTRLSSYPSRPCKLRRGQERDDVRPMSLLSEPLECWYISVCVVVLEGGEGGEQSVLV